MLPWLNHHKGSEWRESTLREWVAIETNYHDKRQFLEEHVELLDPRSDELLQRAVTAYEDEPNMRDMLRLHLLILNDAMRRGGDRRQAARDAYINQYGGLVLDLPPWLQKLQNQLSALQVQAAAEQTAATRIALLRAAIARAAQELDTVAPVTIANLRVLLWSALDDATSDDESQRQEEGIALLEEALASYLPERYPLAYASAKGSLGSALVHRNTGVTAENVERGITCYEAALARVKAEEAPVLWARLQHGLANAYFNRIWGTPSENIELGIVCCEAALTVFTEQGAPESWALVMNTLGNLYQQRPSGGRRENIEQALDCYRAALRVFTLADHPARYALVQNNLGTALRHRLAGDPIANAEFAVQAHFEALKVYTKAAYPLDYAQTLTHLASVSLTRPAVSARQNYESAIRGYREALTIYTLADYPKRYAAIQNNLGIADSDRPGARAEDIEHAIAAYQEALKVYTVSEYPADYANTTGNLASAYYKRQRGQRAENLQFAIAAYAEALRILTPNVYPREHRLYQLGRVWPEAERGNWAAVHEAYAAAAAIEARLVMQEAGEEARAALLREGRDTAVRDGYALVRLRRPGEAAVTIERGRAQGLAETLTLQSAPIDRITDGGRRHRFVAALETFEAARTALYQPLRPVIDQETFLREWEQRDETDALRAVEAERAHAYYKARQALDAVITEIRAAADPADFLTETLDQAAILRAAEAGGPGHALIYLAATPWGGMAVGAFAASADGSLPARVAALDLPQLTFDRVAELTQSRLSDETLHIIGGFSHAQRGNGLNAILLPIWTGATFHTRANIIASACQAASKPSTLVAAAQRALNVPGLQQIIDRPLNQLTDQERDHLAATVNHLFLQEELRACLEKLGTWAVRPLYDWLRGQRATSIALVPCGFLEAFPLAAAPVAGEQPLAEMLAVSVVPSARALLRERPVTGGRNGIYALGDPRPTHQELPWSEAEALTVAKLARQRGWHAEVRVQHRATRDWLLDALGHALVLDASCHGLFQALDPLRSVLLLARGESVTLAETLSRLVDLRGLRLLVLSACQTALPDVRQQTDEVRSLAAAMIQGGAAAVLASLWPVDDRASYVLVVRFMQEWLPHLDHEPPAAALARAQRWMRTLTHRKLHAWHVSAFGDLEPADLELAGAAAGWAPPWRADPTAAGARALVAVRGRGSRYTISEAETRLQAFTEAGAAGERPFADPIYWAGFQILGQ